MIERVERRGWGVLRGRCLFSVSTPVSVSVSVSVKDGETRDESDAGVPTMIGGRVASRSLEGNAPQSYVSDRIALIPAPALGS